MDSEPIAENEAAEMKFLRHLRMYQVRSIYSLFITLSVFSWQWSEISYSKCPNSFMYLPSEI
jgi:hypothetical protein